MKKLSFFIFVMSIAYALNAQITINRLNLNPGDTVFQSTDTTFQTELLDAGTNLDWNFSDLHQQKTDTIRPMDPDTTKHASDFPDATLAFGNADMAGYVVNNSEVFVSLGFGGKAAQMEEDLVMILDDPDTSRIFPMNYGDARYCDSYGSANGTVQGYDIRFSESIFRDQEIDAWGKVRMPNDLTYDVIRVKEYTIKIDSVFLIIFGSESYQEDYSSFDTSYTYSFYTNDTEIKYPLLEVKYDNKEDTILSTKWLAFEGGIETGIATLTNNDNTEISIYPNPSANIITINTKDKITSVNIYNTQGKIVKTASQKQIQVSDLAPAIYFVEVKTKHNIYRQKIIVK